MFIFQTVDRPNPLPLPTPLPVTGTTPPITEPCEGPTGNKTWAELVEKRAQCRSQLNSTGTVEGNNQFRSEHNLDGQEGITQSDLESFNAFFNGVDEFLQGIKGLTVSKAIRQIKNFFTPQFGEEHAGGFANYVVNRMNVDDTARGGKQVIDDKDLSEFQAMINNPNYNPQVGRINRHITEYDAAIRPQERRHDIVSTGDSKGKIDNADFDKFNEYYNIIGATDDNPVSRQDARRALKNHFISQGMTRRQASRQARKIINQMNADGNRFIDANDRAIFRTASQDPITTGDTAGGATDPGSSGELPDDPLLNPFLGLTDPDSSSELNPFLGP